MRIFSQLIQSIEEASSHDELASSLKKYFGESQNDNKIHALALLSGKRPKRSVRPSSLKIWASEYAGINPWLFEESHKAVGDLSETIALLVSGKNKTSRLQNSLTEIMKIVLAFKEVEEEEKKKIVTRTWAVLDYYSCYVFNKLLAGSFRISLSQNVLSEAISSATGKNQSFIAYKMASSWDPEKMTFFELFSEQATTKNHSLPYPFYNAKLYENPIEELGLPNDWMAEWKWDGIRAQLIKRKDEIFVWSHQNELLTEKLQEIQDLISLIPNGTVLDGHILAIVDDVPLSFNDLMRRMSRSKSGPIIRKEIPVIFIAFDLLEAEGKDLRNTVFSNRRMLLEELVGSIKPSTLRISPILDFYDWDAIGKSLNDCRAKRADGIVFKKTDGQYNDQDVQSIMTWNAKPYSIIAVLTYVTLGQGRTQNIYSDYTFGLWQDENLVTLTKISSGLSEEETEILDQFVKKNTKDRFGPVRQVVPELVFELAFDDISISAKRKSGVILKSPRILKWNQEMKLEDVNKLEDILKLLVR